VSLRLRDEQRVVLRPDRVVLAQMKREWTRHGMKRHVHSMQELPCLAPSGDGMPWSGALSVLESVLPELAGKKSHATVILSNHFMRYALIPWSDSIFDAKEIEAYAQHTFREIYGRDANIWELSISSGKSGMQQMAGATDTRLLDSLREMFGRAGVNLKSIQPHLMLAYNACKASLRGRSAWLALVEQGNLCLVLLQEGRWTWVRTMRIGVRWQEELPLLLERETFNACAGSGINDVLLWTPEHEGASFVSGGRWNVQHMQPLLMPSLSAGLESRFAMYMSEGCR
jgi:hypothetical protein